MTGAMVSFFIHKYGLFTELLQWPLDPPLLIHATSLPRSPKPLGLTMLDLMNPCFSRQSKDDYS